jgi:23S rRNA pseudouridine2605 synthase
MYTSGALILTDDGDFVYKITHPKHEVTKTYTVTIKGEIEKDKIEELKNGVEILGTKTSKADVRIIKLEEDKSKTRLEITVHEGKNRQIRRMLEAVDKKVLALHRSRIGKISVKNLKIGTWRYLSQDEIKNLINS